MSPPHLIRLHEPWLREPLAGGGLRLRRFFHRPTGLTPTATVTLVCDGAPEPMVVALNGGLLAAAADAGGRRSWIVTPRLEPRNELTFDLPSASSEGLPWREVRLEICDEPGE